MVDFSKLLQPKPEKPVNPVELFRGLVREPRFEYLRNVQQQVLDSWFANRCEKDTIIKMNTGAGKTLVGLLALQSCLNENISPAAYVCPNKQLVEQVLEQAKQYGFSTTGFGETASEPPSDFLNGDAILVGTFHKLFNGRTVFGVRGSPRRLIHIGALVVDDAHSCLSIARQQVSLVVDRSGHGQEYARLLSFFADSLRQQSLSGWSTIEARDPTAFMAVPHWAWVDRQGDVVTTLVEMRESTDFKFKWELVRDELALCRCVISSDRVEIMPIVVPIERVPALADCERRIFLSATLLDDSVLVRDFGVTAQAVDSSVRPTVRGDIGERMIVVPDLVDPYASRDHTMGYVKSLSVEGYNVVVLVDSFKDSDQWVKLGATVARQQEDLIATLKALRASDGNFVVLANRYDGIDLPEDACRVLVVDGLPFGGTLHDQYLMSARPRSGHIRGNHAQRLEQGLGRGVRSGGDYCVCILMGRDVTSFVSLKANHDLFTAETQKQLDVGLSLSRQVRAEKGNFENKLDSLVRPCLNRDPNWKRYHLQEITGVVPRPADTSRVILAALERNAVEMYRSGDSATAASSLQTGLDGVRLDPADKGWYLQLCSHLAHSADPAKAQQIQLKAYSLSNYLLKPVAGVKYDRLASKAGVQAARVQDWVREYRDANAIPVQVTQILGALKMGVDAKQFEHALRELGTLLGFEAQEPETEFGRGPDVLWHMTDSTYLIIEAKNEVRETRKTISKKEVGQLSTSMEWFTSEYGSTATGLPVMVHQCLQCEYDAYPPLNTKVVDGAALTSIELAVTRFASALAAKDPAAWTIQAIDTLLTGHNLSPGSFRNEFLKPVRTPQ